MGIPQSHLDLIAERDAARRLARDITEARALGVAARSIPEHAHNKWAMLPASESVPMGAVPGLRTRASHDRWLEPNSYQLKSRVKGVATRRTKAESLKDARAGGTVRVIKGDSDTVHNVRGFGRRDRANGIRETVAREQATMPPETARIGVTHILTEDM